MFSSLKLKFIAYFIILEIVFFAIIIGINFNAIDKASILLTNEKVNATSKLLVELIKTPLIVYDLATIDDIVKNFARIENAIGIEIEDTHNNTISSFFKQDSISKALFQENIAFGDMTIVHNDKEYVFHHIDIYVDGKNIGHVHYAFDTSQRLESIQNNKNLTYIMVSIALVISFIIAYAVGENLGKSLNFLNKIARNIAHDKKVDIPKKLNSNDEISSLFKSMDFMQQLIFQRTQKLNNSLKQFSDNVIASHGDLKGNITYASKALCRISGYTEEELLGKPHSILRHQDMSSKVYNELWSTISSGKIWNGELKNKKKNGDYYWVNASIVPEFDDKGNIMSYTSIRHDITAQKAKEDFMANMSHELRTPLNAIIGFSGILNKKLKNEENLSILEHIRSSSLGLLSLINDILDLSKIKDSKFKIEPYEFNVYHEVETSYNHFSGLTAQKNIKLIKNIEKSLDITVLGDWHRISQIILNLISNAIKFTGENGTITFEADYKDFNLVIKISDNGIGMNKDVQDKVFEPFEQADGSTTRKYGGTGLGLSITQNLVEMMNGKIELKSQEGLGTTFTVSIPLIQIESQYDIQSETNIAQDNILKELSGHILIAEDNKTNQLLIKMLLEDIGLSCDIANDGQEAVEMYDPSIHKLILMDENMPRMNGIEAMKILRQKYKDDCGPIVALTANAMAGDKERFLKIGMDGYIAKPIKNEELYLVLNKFLSI